MKAESFKIILPVKPHIRKYMHILYGYPVLIDQNKFIGSIIISLLQKKSLPTGINMEYRKQRRMYLTAQVECFATIYRYQDNGLNLTEDHILAINRLMENQFNDDLYRWMLHKSNPGDVRVKGYNKAMRSFMHYYCLEEDVDITFEALKKAEYRRRTHIENNRKKLLQEFVPNI